MAHLGGRQRPADDLHSYELVAMDRTGNEQYRSGLFAVDCFNEEIHLGMVGQQADRQIDNAPLARCDLFIADLKSRIGGSASHDGSTTASGLGSDLLGVFLHETDYLARDINARGLLDAFDSGR